MSRDKLRPKYINLIISIIFGYIMVPSQEFMTSFKIINSIEINFEFQTVHVTRLNCVRCLQVERSEIVVHFSSNFVKSLDD